MITEIQLENELSNYKNTHKRQSNLKSNLAQRNKGKY